MKIVGLDVELNNDKILFQIGAKSFTTKHDIFVEVGIPTNNKQYNAIYISELRPNNKKGFEWKQFLINATKLDQQSMIRFDVYESAKSKFLLGTGEMNLQNLLLSVNKYIKISKNGILAGEIRSISVKKVIRHTFLDYVYAGCEISLIIALDFTNSNKDPNDNRSLHSLSPSIY